MLKKKKNSRSMSIEWYQECLASSTAYCKKEIEDATRYLNYRLLVDIDNRFRKMQVDAAIKAGKKSFDCEAYMKKKRVEFVEIETAKTNHRIDIIRQAINDSDEQIVEDMITRMLFETTNVDVDDWEKQKKVAQNGNLDV